MSENTVHPIPERTEQLMHLSTPEDPNIALCGFDVSKEKDGRLGDEKNCPECFELGDSHERFMVDFMTQMLDNACWNPDNFQEHEEWKSRSSLRPLVADWVAYPGWRRYDITFHCNNWVVIARKTEPFGIYEIREHFQQDH